MLLAGWILFAVICCNICSLLEATLLSARNAKLVQLTNRGSKGAKRLLAIRRKRTSDAVSAILIVNTFAGTLGAGFASTEAARLWGDGSVGLVSLGMTVLLLIAAEIGPKSFAVAHATQLASWTGSTLQLGMFILYPVLLVTRPITRLFAGGSKNALSREELVALIASAPAEGAISAGEADLLANLIFVQSITLADVNTPASLIFMLDRTTSVADLLRSDHADAFSRIPLFDEEPANVVGYISHREVLKWACVHHDHSRQLDDFARPLPRLSQELSLHDATEALLEQREAIGLVIDDAGAIVGIVTLEDLLESTLGIDITDEPEDVTELRVDANRMRLRRMTALRDRRNKWQNGGSPESSAAP
jgi:CBS domain containing-hemolysin-like protein